MKKTIIGIIISVILIILIFCLIPKQKKINGISLSELNNTFSESYNLDYDYSGQMNKTKAFFSFEITDSILKGSCFINKNKALAFITYFYGIKTANNDYVVMLKFKNRLSYSIWDLIIRGNEYLIVRKYLQRNLFKKYKVHYQDTIHLSRIKEEIIKASGRYKIPLFKSELKYKNVHYGSARGYYDSKVMENTCDYYEIAMECLIGEDVWYKKTLDLNLDIYEPQNDTLSKRPLIVFFHGGAFLIGDKETNTVEEFCNFFASRGYAVAAPNYRMGYGLTKSMMKENIERCGYRAVQDGRAAIRYLAANAEKYHIDTSQIYIAGNSAGGIIALNIAFMDNDERPASSYNLGWGILHKDLGNLDESTNDIESTFTIKGVINMWGALGDSSIINKDENIPILSFHGDKDQIVPYNVGRPFEDIRIAILEKLGLKLNELIFDPMYGSKYISDYYHSENHNYTFITFKGFDHDPQYNPDLTFNSNLDTIKQISEVFLYNNLIPDYSISGPETINPRDNIPEYSVPYCTACQYLWVVNGGVILRDRSNSNQIKVIWFRRNGHNKVNACIRTPNGAMRPKQISVYVN